MKHLFLAFTTFALGLSVSTPVLADLQLATAKNCMACHAVDKKVLGPSYKDIAAKYADQKDAVDKLAVKVIKGSGGVWGTIIAMPSNPQVNPDEAKKLVAWILTQK